MGNFLAITVLYTHTHTQKKRVTQTQSNGAAFSFTVNIIFYCTINTKTAHYFALARKKDS